MRFDCMTLSCSFFVVASIPMCHEPSDPEKSGFTAALTPVGGVFSNLSVVFSLRVQYDRDRTVVYEAHFHVCRKFACENASRYSGPHFMHESFV